VARRRARLAARHDREPDAVTAASGGSARRRLADRLATARGSGAAVPPTTADVPAAPLDTGSMAAFYDSVSAALDATPLGEWSRFLNYGYSDSPTDRSVIDLPAGTLDRASVKLVLELVGDCELRGRRILDVGSGRGGTLAALLEHFAPQSATGVDLSHAAVAFCRRSVRDQRASFAVADAELLPFATEAFDVVTNVESAHCYSDVERFHREVRRVLTPGGVFLCTDILPTESLAWRRAHLVSLGFRLEVERDITAQVLTACDSIARRRQDSFAAVRDAALLNFLAIEGSPTYEGMRSGTITYVIWRLRLSGSTTQL
jgi:SAM-dependent methyltransferase